MSEPNPPESEHLWATLRRRKVVQWGIAYVAAGWGLLQGLEYLSSVFHWTEQLQRIATVGFLVGAPIALVLAWFHGDRGHQKVSGIEFTILTILLLLGGGMFWWVGNAPERPVESSSQPNATPAAAESGPSIAVLPFVNMSDDKANEYFSDGISEELLNVLVRVPGLGVASRTSSFAYKGSPLGTADIARALKVNHVLEGSVRKSGNHVRITAQLINAVNDRHLWSETYDRELTDIFAIQQDIANAIVDALRAQLGGAQSVAAVSVHADTENLEAYQLYLKARELFIARKDLPESIRLFEQVTTLDPDFARGWEGLAAVCSVAVSWGIMDRDYTAISSEAAKRALELDPTLSMPWAVLGNNVRLWPVDWALSNSLLDRAIAADPRNATAYLWRGINWEYLGFFERANADLDRSLDLEPGYLNAERYKAVALLFAGQTDAALVSFQRGVTAGFVVSAAENFIGPLVQRGDRLAALLLMDNLGLSPAIRERLIDALSQPGQDGTDSAAIVQQYSRDYAGSGNAAAVMAHLYLWLGDFDSVGELDLSQTGELVAWDRTPPEFRNSPGFKRLLERSGVVAYWREHGFPPQCRAVGANDFSCD